MSLLGFSNNGRDMTTQFLAPDGGMMTADLCAVISPVLPVAVPEPGFLALFGTDLLGLVWRRRRP